MVEDILKNAEKITLKNIQRVNYFRIASQVIVNGESLRDMLIEAGMMEGRKLITGVIQLMNKKTHILTSTHIMV